MAKTKNETGQKLDRSILSKRIIRELMAAPSLAAPPGVGSPLREAGALVVRRKKRGRVRFLLISKRRSRAWGIPKGRLSPALSFPETAAKEAFEEAGVTGMISPSAICMFRSKKRAANPQVRLVIEVWVYLLEAVTQASEWPEKDKRAVRWVSAKAAAKSLREPTLAHLCMQIAKA